ncbi:MAG: phosphotransferase [Pseudomonadota bacterium]
MNPLSRELQLLAWLRHACGLHQFTLTTASADASFRRYFRVHQPGQASQIVMDAPPDKEDCRPFVDCAARLHAAGVHVPHIMAQDLAQGFLLLEDLGDRLYLHELTTENADTLYGAACRALIRMQSAGVTAGLAQYDAILLRQELQLFEDWFLHAYLRLTLTPAEQTMLHTCFTALVEQAVQQPQVLVHRDFHARNLLVCATDSPGIIDFQDAVLGPVTYDLVSLWRDSYIAWSPERVDTWLADYTEQAIAQGMLTVEQGSQMPRWFDWMGVQRQLKIAGIFARLHLRDGKSSYLADIPQTLAYIALAAERQSELRSLAAFIQQRCQDLQIEYH